MNLPAALNDACIFPIVLNGLCWAKLGNFHVSGKTFPYTSFNNN